MTDKLQSDGKIVLVPCKVPWMVSPSMSGLTLIHCENDEPECKIVFGGGRMTTSGMDSRRIEVTFHGCESSRFGLLRDEEELASKGFYLKSDARFVEASEYLAWFKSQWLTCGLCPESGLWIATRSHNDSGSHAEFKSHYVISGRNGFAELFATSFSWNEWIWESGLRDDVQLSGALAAEGRSVD